MENKQLNLSEPENIMGTMDVNPLLIKLSIPMMISMLVQIQLGKLCNCSNICIL